MRARRLAWPLTVVQRIPRIVRLPVVPAQLTLGNVALRPVQALLDTGAYGTFATMTLATRLGLSSETLRRSMYRSAWNDPDGVRRGGYGERVTLTLGRPGESRVELTETLVYFTETPFGPFELRLGQVGFLDRVTFTQHGDERFEVELSD